MTDAEQAQLNAAGQKDVTYLMRPSPSSTAHVWGNNDTLCRMWSTGGINRKGRWIGAHTPDGRPICKVCLAVGGYRAAQARAKALGLAPAEPKPAEKQPAQAEMNLTPATPKEPAAFTLKDYEAAAAEVLGSSRNPTQPLNQLLSAHNDLAAITKAAGQIPLYRSRRISEGLGYAFWSLASVAHASGISFEKAALAYLARVVEHSKSEKA